MTKGAMDEFAFVLLAGVILIAILMIAWTTPTEFPPKVFPSSIDIQTTPGSVQTFTLNISGKKLTDVELSASGDIANWVKFTKNNFDVAGFTLVDVKLSVPKNALIKTYKGSIKVSSKDGSETVPINVAVEREIIRALESRSVQLGDFFVGFTSSSKDLDSRQNVQVNKGYFSERSVNLVGSITDKELSILQGASINIVVEDANKLGNLIVTFNDNEVFNKKVGSGEIVIPLEKEMLKKANVVNIKADTPGLVFWANTLYQLRSAKLVVDLEGSFAKELSFKLKSTEVSNFDSLRLAYKVDDFSSNLPELTIKLNDQVAFQSRPSATSFDEKFDKDVFGDPLILNEADNSILFSFENEASYTVSNAVLTVFYKG
ncbi:MAG: hypothetical protein HY361_03820 [Candidatus Aenigmarchaeota archaeon]|nr:hypothetical protein [Candidatus Aenigmarchaeota archaeon]